MSRKRNSAVKQIAAEPSMVEKFLLSAYGAKYHGASHVMVMGFRGLYKLPMDERVKELENLKTWLAGQLAAAVETRNGAFFRDLADTIETVEQGRATDPARFWLLQNYFNMKPPYLQVIKPTFMELKRAFKKAGFDTTEDRSLRRMCGELGLELAPGKAGRPKQ